MHLISSPFKILFTCCDLFQTLEKAKSIFSNFKGRDNFQVTFFWFEELQILWSILKCFIELMTYLLKILPTGGIPISKGPECVKMPCIFIPPENRFKYIWKKLIQNQVSNWTPLCAEKMHTTRIYHMVHLNSTDFWADYFFCCHNAK